MRLLFLRWLAMSLLAGATATQLTLQDDDPSTTSTNMVDLLSQDPQLSHFIHLLQRARTIPTLNRMSNFTLYAPTNDALKDSDLFDEQGNDNLQYRLRERLFYHMLNYTADNLSFSDPEDSRIVYESTLLFPTTHEEHGRPGTVPYPAPQDTLLGGEGQKLAILRGEKGQPDRIGVNEAGEGGAAIIAGRGGKARNGNLIVIDAMLDPPKSIAHQIRARSVENSTNSLSRFASLLREEMWKNLTESSHTTVFIPEDKAFDALNPLEWTYLNSGFAGDDILEIARNHRTELTGNEAQREKVGYLNRLLDVGTIPVASGDAVIVSCAEEDKIKVNKSQIITGNILASNGVMHIIDSLLLPRGSLALTAEKYLLALNATKFVTLYRESGLSHLLQSSPGNPENNASYTILAAKDDVLERLVALPWASLPANGTKELKETLKYHVIEGKFRKKELVNGSLLKTTLRTAQLGDQPQRIAVSVIGERNELSSFRKSKRGSKDSVEIAFGGANVIAEPIEAGNSIIYLISRVLEPPSSFVSTALDKGLSTFVAAVYSSGLDKKLLHGSPATTFLAPTNKAFDYMGLAINYFLLPSAREDLGQMLQYHAIKGSVYLSELASDSQAFETLEGSEIYLEQNVTSSISRHHRHERSSNPHVRVRGPLVDGLAANGDNRPAKVRDADLLTSTGVLHVIDQVELPPTLNITSEKLMRGARASTFPDLLRQVNMSWLAEGKQAPADFEETYANLLGGGEKALKNAKKVFVHDSYTILCPTDLAFTRINLTHYLNDLPSLLALVQMHIIPSPSSSDRLPPSGSLKFPSDGRPIALVDDGSFPTLYSKSEGGSSRYGEVAFRKSGGSDWLVGIKGARGNSKNDYARILNSGRNTPILVPGREESGLEQGEKQRMVFGGGVLLIDGVLEPYEPTWWQRWGSITVIVVLGLAVAAGIGTLAWKLYDRRKKQREHYETLPQENEED